MEEIISRDNQRVKELACLLSSKKKRDTSGLFAIEGARLCCDAFASGVPIQKLFLTRECIERYPKLEAVIAQERLFISPELARRMGDTQTPQGAFAICEKYAEKDAPAVKKNGRYLLLANLQDPGNLGTILRTAQALGIDGVYLSGCPDLYAPKVLRAAMGGIFRLNTSIFEDSIQMVRHVQAAGLCVYAAALTEHASPISKINLSDRCAVIIGNEGNGLEQELIDQCNGSIIIPMRGNAESLNAAVAASLFIWEMTK